MGAAEDFVENLKVIIQEKKHNTEFKKNILQESVDVLKSLFESHDGFFIKSVKDFDSKNFSFLLDLVSEHELSGEIPKILTENNIAFHAKELSDYKTVFLLDIGRRIFASGSPNNLLFIEIISKKYSQYRLRFTLFNPGVNFSVFEKNFFLIKLWIFDHGNVFSIHEIDMNKIGRYKKKQKIKLSDEKYNLSLTLNDLGEFSSLSVKRAGEKTKK